MNKHLGFTANTKVLGIMGYPVAHSLSPVMQNAALDFWDLDLVYLAFAVPPRELKAALTGIKTFGFTGVNITIPYKEAVIPCLDLLTPEAEALGAVNVIRQENQKLIGHNTDGAGFLQVLAEEFDFCPQGKKVLILGAGGAARAVALSLAEAGAAQLGIANRTREKAQSLVASVKKKVQSQNSMQVKDLEF